MRTKIANGEFQEIQHKEPIIVKVPNSKLFSDVAEQRCNLYQAILES